MASSSVSVLGRGFQKVCTVATAQRVKAHLRTLNIAFGDGLTVLGTPIVTVAKGATISLGKRVVLCSLGSHTALGVAHPVVLRAMLPGARLVIGDDVGMSGASICAAVHVEIGSGTLIGANVMIADTDFHPIETLERRYMPLAKASHAEVIIDENVFIGANTIILKGVRIGRDSVIGAGSVVSRDVPPGVIAAGNPCRVIRALGDMQSEGPRS